VPEPEPERMEEDPERQRNAKTPVGNGRNGCNGINKVMGMEEERELEGVRETPNRERGGDLSVPSVPPSQGQGFIHAAPVPESVPEARSVPPPPSGTPITVDGRGGWLLPGSLPKGEAPTVKVVCVDPAGNTRLIERKRIALGGGAA
jgi:hypothetical protein